MIERLLIKDSITFREVCITPSPAFNIFSGVSGSGKSVLMESILALFGLKETNANLIEATLQNIPLPEEIKADSEIVLSIVKKDKVKYFLNAQSFSKRRAKELFGEYVKYITAHSVNELKAENLLNTLDSLIKHARFKALRESFAEDFSNLVAKQNELATLENEERNVASLRELAAYEITQIESVNPKVGEYEDLLEIKKDLSKKEKILEKIAVIKPHLEGFSGIVAFLESIDKSKEIYGEILREIEGVIIDEEERLENLSSESIEEISILYCIFFWHFKRKIRLLPSV